MTIQRLIQDDGKVLALHEEASDSRQYVPTPWNDVDEMLHKYELSLLRTVKRCPDRKSVV